MKSVLSPIRHSVQRWSVTLLYLSTFIKYLYFTGVVLFWVTFTSLHFIKHIVTPYNTSRAPRCRSSVWFMNKLIIFNESVQSVHKSQQKINSRIWMIRLQLFSSRVTDSNEPFRASLQWTELTRKKREISWCCESKLLMSNFRINYWNWK